MSGMQHRSFARDGGQALRGGALASIGERGDGRIVLLIGVGVVVLLVLLGWSLASKSKEREADRLFARADRELESCRTLLQGCFEDIDGLAVHWEMTRVRENVDELKKRVDQLGRELARLHESRDALATDGATARSLVELIGQARLLAVRLGDLSGEVQQRRSVLAISLRLTRAAVAELGAVAAETVGLRQRMEGAGIHEEIWSTQLDLLDSGRLEQQSLFKRGIESLMEGDVNGRASAQAAISATAGLRREVQVLSKDIEARLAAVPGEDGSKGGDKNASQDEDGGQDEGE